MRRTIKSNAEISAIFSLGERYNTSGMTFIVLESQHDPNGRVAFIAGKKNGNAVWRNAAKRRMRALCAELGGPWGGFDVIALARRGLLKVSYQKLLTEAARAIKTFDKQLR